MINIATHIPWPPVDDEARSIIDDPIYEVVDMMNRAGFHTVWSCCGYGDDANGKPHRVSETPFVKFEAKIDLVDRLLAELDNISETDKLMDEYHGIELFYQGKDQWCLRLSPETVECFIGNHRNCGAPEPEVFIKRSFIAMLDGALNRLLIKLEQEREVNL